MKRLSELKIGEWARVLRVEGAPVLRHRLETMGFVKGVRVGVKRCAPMGDPRAYELLGYCISLRQEEAAMVLVEPLPVYPLSAAPAGRLKVIQVSGGPGMRGKLAQLGVVENALLTLHGAGARGPITFEIDHRRFQLGRGMARRILVMKEENAEQTAD
jgi:Fe2+ transport system protein FeoA